VPSNGYGTTVLYAVARDTGVPHIIGYLHYIDSTTGGYVLTSGDGMLDANLVPGTYDILYDRDENTSSTGWRYVSRDSSTEPFPAGWRILRSCVAVP
jgi:hypothetical protein